MVSEWGEGKVGDGPEDCISQDDHERPREIVQVRQLCEVLLPPGGTNI